MVDLAESKPTTEEPVLPLWEKIITAIFFAIGAVIFLGLAALLVYGTGCFLIAAFTTFLPWTLGYMFLVMAFKSRSK